MNLYMMEYLIVSSEPICECDNRGTYINEEYGNWCWFKEGPCRLLTGNVVNWEWARCSWNGAIQVKC